MDAVDTAEYFLTCLHRTYVSLPGAHTALWFKKDDAKPSFHFQLQIPGVFRAAAEQAVTLAAQGFDTYVGLGVRKRDCGRHSRGGNDDVIALPGFWMDFDCQNTVGAHKADQQMLPTKAQVLEFLVEEYERPGRPPSMITDSGYGLHAYWLSEKPWTFSDAIGRKVAQGLVAAWQEQIRTQMSARGWHVDMTADLARVLRVPGTFNCKGIGA